MTTEAIAFELQPKRLQAIFHSRAAGRELTAEELYDKIPAHLTNNPNDVVKYLKERDVSRIISGKNGGSYTDDNVVLEEASSNRARQAANITAEELEAIEAHNTVDAALIDAQSLDSPLEAVELVDTGFSVFLPVRLGIHYANRARKDDGDLGSVVGSFLFGALLGDALAQDKTLKLATAAGAANGLYRKVTRR